MIGCLADFGNFTFLQDMRTAWAFLADKSKGMSAVGRRKLFCLHLKSIKDETTVRGVADDFLLIDTSNLLG